MKSLVLPIISDHFETHLTTQNNETTNYTNENLDLSNIYLICASSFIGTVK